MERRPYPIDVSSAEWALVAPYSTLMTKYAPRRKHPLREVFNGLRWLLALLPLSIKAAHGKTRRTRPKSAA
jgi:hypothetical protein